MEPEPGITISGASIAKGIGSIMAVLATGAIIYVASAIPKIQTELAVISQVPSDTKKTDEKQWEYIGKLSERMTETREYLAGKGWEKDK